MVLIEPHTGIRSNDPCDGGECQAEGFAGGQHFELGPVVPGISHKNDTNLNCKKAFYLEKKFKKIIMKEIFLIFLERQVLAFTSTLSKFPF